MMSIKIKNDFDGSNPTAEMPKISFSCGLDKSKIRTFVRMDRGSDFFIFRKIRHFEGRSKR